ncbi:MAG: LPS export ABC transporter periplasmic protein LptC [Amoebophilaceae bacterium]|nr:LPS export ABC transporter periplasmic protein LptC [Amoebophilaceae bacterium]
MFTFLKKKAAQRLVHYGVYLLPLSMPLYAETTLPDDEVAVIETTQLELLATDLGILKYNLKAATMCQYKNGNLTLHGGVEITLLDEATADHKEEEATYIQADKLSYIKTSALYILEGNVRINKPTENLKITTEKLSYHTEENIVYTDLAIEIEQNNNILKGVGLHTTKDFKKYSIGSPNGILDTKEFNEVKL